MTREEKRIEKMEVALRVIRTWAKFYDDRFDSVFSSDHKKNYKHIVNACTKALKK